MIKATSFFIIYSHKKKKKNDKGNIVASCNLKKAHINGPNFLGTPKNLFWVYLLALFPK